MVHQPVSYVLQYSEISNFCFISLYGELKSLNGVSCTCVLQPFETPQHLAGTWNCSVPHWPRFQRHFRCNMRQECANEEDETECPHSSCEHGGVRIEHDCYFYVVHNIGITWFEAQRKCRLKGAQLASLSSPAKWNGIMTWLRWRTQWRRRINGMFVGLKSAPQGLPFMYVDGCLVHPVGRCLMNHSKGPIY